MLLFFLVACLTMGVSIYAVSTYRKAVKSDSGQSEIDAAFDEAEASSDGITRLLVRTARPFASLPVVHDQKSGPAGRWIQEQLLLSGDKFSGSVEVFIAVQTVAVLISMLSAGLAAAGAVPWFIAAAGVLAAGLPVNTVMKASKSRTAEISAKLPEFAELLQMPLSAGNGVLTSLDFCAQRLRGVIADEVSNLLILIRTRSMTEAEAFVVCGERLGTSEAKAFFTTLLQAHLEGAKVVESIAAQADSLRKLHFERRRAEVKKLPVKFVFIFAAHMITSMMMLALAPAIASLTDIT